MPKSGRRAKPQKPTAKPKRIRLWHLAAGILFSGILAWAAFFVVSSRGNTPSRYHPRPTGSLTFSKDIAPIVFENCSVCHRPGQSAPCDLLTYADVKRHAQQIAEITTKRIMPPWLPENGHEPLQENRALSVEQIGLINQWVAEGARQGNPAESPPLPKWPEDWEMGKPDLVVKMPEPYLLPPEGKDVYRNFILPVPLPLKRYVRAFEFKAASKAIHHAFIRLDNSGESRALDAKDPAPGFDGMIVPPSEATPGGHFLSWQPGRRPCRSPEGLEWALPSGADIVLLLHMQPRGKPELVQPSIAFYFTDVPPTNSPVKLSLMSYDIDIQAGESSHAVGQKTILPVDTDLLAVLPHTHYLAKRVETYADLPDGTRKTLLVIPEWDFNWQSDFKFAEPVFLPRGTSLGMKVVYDNSTNNFRNPQHPPVRVRYGLQTTNEMAEVHYQMLAHNPSEQEELRKAANNQAMRSMIELSQHRLQEDPNDARSMLQMAKMLFMERSVRAAEALVRKAIATNPNLPDAHYTLGTMLFEARQFVEAEREFVETVRLDPSDYKAHNNAGLCCFRQARIDDAAIHFEEVLRLHPEDEIAKGNLALLAQARRTLNARK